MHLKKLKKKIKNFFLGALAMFTIVASSGVTENTAVYAETPATRNWIISSALHEVHDIVQLSRTKTGNKSFDVTNDINCR